MRKKSGIAFFSITDKAGGAENLVLTLFALVKGSRSIFYLSKWIDRKEVGGDVCYFSDSKNFYIGILKLILNGHKLNSYEYLFSTHLYLNAILGLLKKIGIIKNDVNLIFRESTSIFLRAKGLKLVSYRIAYRLGYGKQGLIITQSELMKNQLLENLPKAKGWNIKSIPNPIDIKTILKKGSAHKVVEKDFIVAVGRLIPEKGFDLLIESFHNVKRSTGVEKLIIIGEGPERENLESLIRKLSLQNEVSLLGYIENPMPYMKSASLCVMSSRVEGFPNVLLQMMALNGNVVSTLCAGGIEKLKGVQTCRANDEESLRNTILQSLLIRKDESELFHQELSKRSVEGFWESVMNNYKSNVAKVKL